MADLVSIITPAFRAESMLCHAVRSVLAQAHQQWEMLIVADDGCDYRAILRDHHIADDRLRFFATSKPQSGPNIARNIALAAARGDWIAPLDADDVFYPQRLTRLLDAARRSGLALDNFTLVGEHLDARMVVDEPYPRRFGFGDFEKSLAPLLFLFHRRHIHFPWDEDVARGADTLFNLRALESAGGADFVAEPLHEYRVHGASMCHADGAAEIFVDAYRHTLCRLKADGMGFRTAEFRRQVIAMLEEKQRINSAFASALQKGYGGNYQSFVRERNLC